VLVSENVLPLLEAVHKAFGALVDPERPGTLFTDHEMLKDIEEAYAYLSGTYRVGSWCFSPSARFLCF
jgi:hypothetical protein